MNRILPTYTALRHEWLRHLGERGSAKRNGWGSVAYHCARNGWCDWTRDVDGKMDSTGNEQLTDAGRAELAEWDARPS